ncbi:SpoIID/LytB domain [metagenome]|uniref:SpoIID/LytB domain n=1 Tax=metagenome TaxID=256318 RepID=A0A2P2C519_9ZZZZ
MLRLRVLAAAGTAALFATSLHTAAPSFSADAAVPVPPQAWVTITGHGYGHGHGMSQYGAEGAARQGLSAQAIINFYYPGTERGTEAGKISVHLTADTDDTTVVLARAGLTVRDLATKQVWTLPDNGARRWRLSVGPAGASRVGYRTDAWHSWKKLEGDGAFSAGGAPITLVTPAGQVAYRGALRSLRPSNGSPSRDTVNVLKLDSYLRGVVPREMPATWTPAAVRAQAIAARTYAAYERAHPLSSTYQICDTTSCQVYGGHSAEHPDSNAAIVATAGKVQTYDGEPAFTQFASSSGGWTSAGSVPYLVAQADPYDDWSGNPVHTWSTKIDARTIEQAWPALGDLEAIRVTARDGNGAWGGRVVTLRLVGAKANVTLSGDTFRSALGLRSTWLSFKAAPK